MISNSAFYRQDITESKSGLPLMLALTIVNVNSGCTPVANATVEVWQCDAAGVYSEYGSGAGQTFLRGLQKSDASGVVTFKTIYPGWYMGRATHIHLEVFVNGASVKTTQLRDYTIKPGQLEDFVSAWSKGVRPLRQKRGGQHD